jgi:hypothetical protein
MTRARAKLLGQQVNSLLVEFDVCDNENFILPKSMHLCMIRVINNTSVDGGQRSSKDWSTTSQWREGGAGGMRKRGRWRKSVLDSIGISDSP